MLEKYNNEIKKIVKLLIMLISAYVILSNVPSNKIDKSELLKIIALIGIVFIVLDNYYPNVDIL